MRAFKKLSLYYFSFGIGFTFLMLGIFAIMCSIEGMTSLLEDKLSKRNLGDIADHDYNLDVVEPKDERVDFLNSLTDFFYLFHENTMDFKNRLDNFMMERTVILERFNRTDIKFHNMTIVPNKYIDSYIMKPRLIQELNGSIEQRKQFPFSKLLVFDKNDLSFFAKDSERNHVYLVCSARIRLTSNERTTTFKAHITEYSEKAENSNYMHFKIQKGESRTFQINRVMAIKDMRKAKIFVNGISPNNLDVQNVEAFCISFTDLKKIENILRK